MNTDRELLELAAKAAGYSWRGFSADGKPLLNSNPNQPEPRIFCPVVWNPITDDGDALRLAVKLGIVIDASCGDEVCVLYIIGGIARPITDYEIKDLYAATRRAIVRAAAEIGRSMK